MNRALALTKLPVGFLLATLLPSLSLARTQSPRPARQVIFEISSKSWSVYASNECDQLLNLRLYSTGGVEYEVCQSKPSDSGKPSYSILRKETNVMQKDIATLVGIVEGSGFPKTKGRMHSGTNLVDAGYTITLTYYVNGEERTLEVVNYDPDSKLLPGWLFKIMKKSSEFLPKDE